MKSCQYVAFAAMFGALFWGREVIFAQVSAPARTPTLNPDISLDGLFSVGYFSKPYNLEFGAHDPSQRGTTVQNIELTLGSVVDPYFRGDAHIIFALENGESRLELEEVYLTSLAFPKNFQLLAGQFFSRFGRLNWRHPHQWDFVDQAVVHNRFFGPDGLRNPGFQLSYLFPLPFFLEFTASQQNADGETAVSFLSAEGEDFAGRTLRRREVNRLGDFLYMTRLHSAVDLNEATTVVFGTSALFGPNASGEKSYTKIYGGDLYLKWRPVKARFGFPFFSFQTEALYRSYEAGEFISGGDTLQAETLGDWGIYSQALYGFIRRWVAGARIDLVHGSDSTDPLRDIRQRGAINLSFYPSEFSKWRIQYNIDWAQHLNRKPIHALFLQFEFLMGAHGAHKF